MDIAAQRKRGRPPKRIDGGLETRQALVRAGVIALTEKGFAATGIDDVLTQVGVPKGSFYHYFASKEAFGAELIDSYAAYFDHKLDRWLGDRRQPRWGGCTISWPMRVAACSDTTTVAAAWSAILARKWRPCRSPSAHV